jgi:hypothetical protein
VKKNLEGVKFPVGRPVPKEKNMTTANEPTDAFANLLEKGFERVLEASKSSLDLTVKYNTEVLEATRKAFKLAPNTPGLFLFDVAGKAFENYAELEKNVLGILGEHGTAVAGAVRESGKAAVNLASKTASAFQESVDRTAAAHKAILDFAAKQNKQVVEAVKKQQGVAGTPLADLADALQHGMDALITAQKNQLETAASQLKSATKA